MEDHKRTVSLQLPFTFNVIQLENNLSALINQHWIPHFNTGGYQGEWNAISLYTKHGEETNIYVPTSEDEHIVETEILKSSPYLKEVIKTFKCSIISARLLRLGVGAKIKPHRDYELGYEDGCFRIHVPIKTNNQVEFILNGKQVVMQPGECWYTNVNYIHSVENLGETDRVHLVMDFKRNTWSDELFYSLAPQESFLPEPPIEDSLETKKQILEELKRMGNPNNQVLISELEKEILS